MKRTAVVAVLGLAVLGASLASAVTPPERAALPVVSQDPVNFAWALDPDLILKTPTPHLATSRQYRLVVDGADLRSGVELPLTGPGAILRFNPTDTAASVDPSTIRLAAPGGREISADDGLESLVDAAAMKASGAPFVEGTSAVRVVADVRGRATLSAEASDGRWVVSVFEPESRFQLEAQASALSYLTGDTATATVSLIGAYDVRADTVTGSLVSPDGATLTASLARLGDNTWRIEAELPAGDLRPGALWEFQMTASGRSGDLEVRRDIATAFAVVAPVARMSALPTRRAFDDGIGLVAPVEASAAGRYEVRAVVWGTDAEGSLRPAAMVHSARYLPAGHGEIELTVDGNILTTHGLKAPWQVRGLQLMDQGRMGLLHELSESLNLD
jgi:hypothetical protein